MDAFGDLIATLAGGPPRPLPANLFGPSPVARLTSGARLYSLPGQHQGLITPGTIDLLHRPVVRNPDGSVSTVRSMSFGLDGGREVLVPTVVGGRVVSPSEAIAHYRHTGEHLGIFNSVAAADAYAQRLHQQQARLYVPKRP